MWKSDWSARESNAKPKASCSPSTSFSPGTGAVSSTVRATGPEALLALVLLVMEASSLPVASAMTACRPRSLAAFSGEPTNRTDQPLG